MSLMIYNFVHLRKVVDTYSGLRKDGKVMFLKLGIVRILDVMVDQKGKKKLFVVEGKQRALLSCI